MALDLQVKLENTIQDILTKGISEAYAQKAKGKQT